MPNIPVQSAVYRRQPTGLPAAGVTALSQMMLDFDILDKDTNGNLFTVDVQHLPLFGRYDQTLPSDPGSSSLSIPVAVAICPTLAPYAAARCGWR